MDETHRLAVRRSVKYVTAVEDPVTFQQLQNTANKAKQEWIKLCTQRENARYALFIVRELQTHPLDFESRLDSFYTQVNRNNGLPQEYRQVRLREYEDILNDCRMAISDERKKYEAPAFQTFNEMVVKKADLIHKLVNREMIHCKEQMARIGAPVLTTIGSSVAGHSLIQSYLQQPVPFDITEGGKRTIHEMDVVGIIRSKLDASLKVVSEKTSIPVTDLRNVLDEFRRFEQLLSSKSSVVTLVTIWRFVHQLCFIAVLVSSE
jgi:hypothetical protein